MFSVLCILKSYLGFAAFHLSPLHLHRSLLQYIVIEFTPEEKPHIIMWYFQIQSHAEYISRSEARQLIDLSGGVGRGALIGLIGVGAGSW